MDRSIRKSWGKIEKVLKAHAPQVLKDLKGPATSTAISKLEKAIGLELPGSLRTSLMIHNGNRSDRFFEQEKLLSVQDIGRTWKLRTKVAADLVEMEVYTAKAIRRWWHEQLIPITDCEGDGFCLDMSRKGRVLYHVHDDRLKVKSTSHAQWLKELAEKLERGEFKLEDDALWLTDRQGRRPEFPPRT